MSETNNRQPLTRSRHFPAMLAVVCALLAGAGIYVVQGSAPANIAMRAALGGLGGLLFGLLLGRRITASAAAPRADSDDGALAYEDDPRDHVWFEEEGEEKAHPEPQPEPAPVMALPAGEAPVRRRQLFNPRQEMAEQGIGDAAPAIEEAVGVEPVAEDAAPAPKAQAQPAPGDAMPPAALTDLSLGELTRRLASAIAEQKLRNGAKAESQPAQREGDVVTFLRRETGRTPPSATPDATDAQIVLKQALDKLTQVSNPRLP